jgi:fumarate reductase flavoprotein subunit
MKKITSILLGAVLLIGMTACASTERTKLHFTAGIYTATVQGVNGKIPVTVEFTADSIKSVIPGRHFETAGLGKAAIDSIAKQIVDKQTLGIDAVAGATVSSYAFLQAVQDCAVQAGGDIAVLIRRSPKPAVQPAGDVSADIIIAGGGAAGLSAGIYAKYAGVGNVILLEKLPYCGGSTQLSGGVITRSAMAGDPAGTMTAGELLQHYVDISGGGDGRMEMFQKYVDESPDIWSWVNKLPYGEQKYRFHLIPENAMGTNPEGGGYGLIRALETEARRTGVDIRTSHNVKEILRDTSGRITGFKVINADGAEQNFLAKAVVLATGGFANNKALLLKYAGSSAGNLVEMKGHAGANGDGILMAEQIGAKLYFGNDWDTSGMNNEWLEGFSTYVMQFSSIMVNDEGRRFVREDAMYPTVYEEMVVNQIGKGHTGGFWIILGNSFNAGSNFTDADLTAAVADGQLSKCATIDEVIQKTGLPAETLRSTIQNYAAMGTRDTQFNKDPRYMGKISANGPFYVTPTHAVRSGTMGGIVINTKSEVLDNQNRPIPGFYAAGETANGSFFDNYYYICGNMNMHAIMTGRQAGQSAAAFIK